MGQRSFLGSFTQEHPNDRPHVMLNLDDENFFAVSQKNRATSARGQDASNLHWQYVIFHTDTLDAHFQKLKQEQISLPSPCPFPHNPPMDFAAKILPASNLGAWREQLRASGRKLVVTNGCFDVLHLGHVTYLQAARQLGDVLLVGVNGDEAVRQLKGPGRPVNPEYDRAAVLAALEAVNAVSIFADTEAAAFLQAAQPDIYVKGADYTRETMNANERKTLESVGAQIHFLPFVAGKSTTRILRLFNNT
jgi:rfaE bifunctional protein nucleotidyltransferase chain/domain